MKFIFEQTKQGNWHFKLNCNNQNVYHHNSIAIFLDIDKNEFTNIIIQYNGIRGYEINPYLCYDDYFYFKTFEQRLEFEEKMEPYLVMARLMR